MTPQMRLLTPSDAGSLALLEGQFFADAWSAEHFTTLLSRDTFLAVGAFENSRLCAYLTAWHFNDEMEILNVAVAANLRGQGLGTALLRFFLRTARTQGVWRVMLEVRASNHVALALYRRCGFTPHGVRPRYYGDTGEDALILAWEQG